MEKRENSYCENVATGEEKADIVGRALTARISEDLPATRLCQHAACTFVLDIAAASKLAEYGF